MTTYANSQDALVAIIAGLSAYTDGRSSAGNILIVYNKSLTEIIDEKALPDEAVIISYENSSFDTYEESDDRITTENYTIYMKTINADPITKIYAIVNQLQSDSRFIQTNLSGGVKKITIEGNTSMLQISTTNYMSINISIK